MLVTPELDHLRNETLFSRTCNIPRYWKITKRRSCL